jgi:undecaprenyl-diphosphatase
MTWFEALILGIIQGLTEFLPISSSGHLELGKAILDTSISQSLLFTVVVHGATVLSIIVVFWKDIASLVIDVLKFEWNTSTRYMIRILVSMIPILIVGVFFKEQVEALFVGNLVLVGVMLIITAGLLALAYFYNPSNKPITNKSAFIVGIAQALAVMPGISRSGATISTGLLLGAKRKDITRFSFLMVLIPIIGANILDLSDQNFSSANFDFLPLLIGFLAAFISGLFACRWMIRIINQGKWIYFAYYCLIVGLIAIFFG